jgi:hypothetical protein
MIRGSKLSTPILAKTRKISYFSTLEIWQLYILGNGRVGMLKLNFATKICILEYGKATKVYTGYVTGVQPCSGMEGEANEKIPTCGGQRNRMKTERLVSFSQPQSMVTEWN